jgi:nucleoside-diphosphate-sugar epimerase
VSDIARPTVGITGVSGFVGGAIADAFERAGWSIVALNRRPLAADSPRRQYRHYDLAEPVPESLLTGLHALVHAAYDARQRPEPDESLNVSGTQRLIRAAREAGIEIFAFISSLASGPSSNSSYGQMKYRIERMLDERTDLIVRPGLVAGSGGLYAAMRGVISRFGVAPIFDGGHQPVYVVDVDELARAVVHLVGSGARGTFSCAAPEPLELGELYAAIAAAAGVAVRRISLPFGPALMLATSMERCGIRLPVSAESLRGIANLQRMEMSSPRAVGVAFSPAERAVRNAEVVRA